MGNGNLVYIYYIIVTKFASFHRVYDLIQEHMIFPFGNINVSKKVNYLLRQYDLFIQENTKVTPEWGELTFGNAFWGSS